MGAAVGEDELRAQSLGGTRTFVVELPSAGAAHRRRAALLGEEEDVLARLSLRAAGVRPQDRSVVGPLRVEDPAGRARVGRRLAGMSRIDCPSMAMSPSSGV